MSRPDGANASQSAGTAVARNRILLVGPGFRFLSGLSVYTCSLANALTDTHDVSVLLLDRLIPRRLYPGAARVGHDLTSLSYHPRVNVVGTVDWYWGAGITGLAERIRSAAPDAILLQWWTAASLHTYLLIARIARGLDIPVFIEFHEAQDTGEAAVPGVARYGRLFLARLIRQCSGAIFHSQHDREMIADALGPALVQQIPSHVAPHGPYDHMTPRGSVDGSRQPGDGPARVLFFGLIRPYKGAEDLIAALDGMTPDQAGGLEVDVVGETWEKWTAPAEAIAASPYRDRIHFVNRYVSDAEATEFFSRADMLVLPYRRGSASGPLQTAMSNGIAVILYDVGGLSEAVHNYPGATLVPPGDIAGLRHAILEAATRRGRRYRNPHTWTPLAAAIDALVVTSRS